MSLGKFQLAQIILDEHKPDIEKFFPDDHPAQVSVLNNQGMLHKMSGKYEIAKEMFLEVNDAYNQIYG